jgi:FkbM family methyltransferase
MVNNLKALFRRCKYTFLRLTNQIPEFRIDYRIEKKWMGNDYGGFFVHPKNISQTSIIYSFGIGEDISFDLAVSKEFRSKIFMFDPTPKSINWVKKQNLPKEMKFFDYGISDKSGFVDFFLPENPNHVSGSATEQNNVDLSRKISVEMKTIKEIFKQLDHTKIDILKMDIEGSEYDVLDDILNSDIKIEQILIEFHSRFFLDGKDKTKKAIEKLKLSGYKVFAVSTSLEEVSFIKLI